MKKVVLIVLDSLGIGELPDADKYGDVGSNTFGHILDEMEQLQIPNLKKMGLGNIGFSDKLEKVTDPIASYGKAMTKSAGKDTTTGHWEMMGIINDHPMPTYPNGFPKEIIDEIEKQFGIGILGNTVASGTKIIADLGAEHMATGKPIIYTSADSVLQIACHEEIVPLDRLYEMCKIAREIMQGEHGVGRIIARPFIGQPGNFTRTTNRHDFSLVPPHNYLNMLNDAGIKTYGVGKISDIFAGCGIDVSYGEKGNECCTNKTIELIKEIDDGFVFTNLVDFDMLYGHRNDVFGYGHAIEEFDKSLDMLIPDLGDEDLLIITADHGNDPSTPSTDHSREYVPILVYCKSIDAVNIVVRSSLSDIGATVYRYLTGKKGKTGESFLDI